MPDTPPGPFISYSRKDQAFVRRLHDVLRAHGRDAWVDWDDILPTAEWMQSIRAGIDAAPAVVVVLSPDAITSPVCAQELDYALAQRKRLIPIVCRPVDADTVAEDVRKLNWLVFTAPGAVEANAAALLAALDTDLGWVQAHSRLLVRAHEWEMAGRDASRLLRGADLKAFEQQLAAVGAAQSPQPTPLQKQFVLASRQGDTRRQRLVVAATGTALVVTAVLAIVAVLQWQDAERQRRVAVARLLAAQSLKQSTEATGRADMALLLAATAVSIDPSPQANESLWLALLETRHARKFVHPGHTLQALAVSPDGRVVVSGGFDGELTLWDARTLEPLLRRAASDDAARGARGAAALAFSPDGTWLATAGAGGIALRDPATAEVRRMLVAGGERPTRVAWSRDGKLLFAASINEAVIRSWDVASGSPRPAIAAHERGVRDIAVSPDGRTLVSAGNDDPTPRLWDLPSGRERLRLQGHASGLRSVAFSRDGTLVASGDDDSLVLVHVAATGALRATLKGQPGRIGVVAFGADSRRLASGSDNRTVFLWDLDAPASPEILSGHGNGVLALAFSADGQALYSAAFEDTLIGWTVDAAPHQATLALHRGAVRALAVSADGRRFASGGEDRTVRLWDAAGGAGDAARLEGHRGAVRALAFSADGSLLASGSDDDRRVIVWDTATRRPRRMIDAGGDVTAVAISPDGGLLATACESQPAILLWNLATGERGGELAGHDGDTTALVFGADGRTLVSGGSDQAVRVWDVVTGHETLDPIGAGGTVHELALAGAGPLLASFASWPGGLTLRDLRQPGVAHEPPTRTPGGEGSVGFDAAGTTLAYTADEFRMTIVLWDVVRARPRIEMVGRSTATRLAFVAGGARLASGHSDGSVVLHDVDMVRWPERACKIANRNLTREEWATAVGDSLPYRPACPALPAAKADGG
jgi:WD40 repeat protein